MHKETRSAAGIADRPNLKSHALALLLLGGAVTVQAAEVPNTFSAGAPARAAEVNANFTALTDTLTTVEGEVDALRSSVTVLEADTGALGSDKVSKDGDVMTGTLTVPQLDYSTPKTHYYALSGDEFKSMNSAAEARHGGRGGTWVTSAGYTGAVTAALNLPDGAVIRAFTVHMLDESPTQDLTTYFVLQQFAGAYVQIAAPVSTTGQSTETQVVGRELEYTVENLGGALRINVAPASGSWPGDASMVIRGVVVEYELASAL